LTWISPIAADFSRAAPRLEKTFPFPARATIASYPGCVPGMSASTEIIIEREANSL